MKNSLILMLGLVLLLSCNKEQKNKDQQPNIVFCLADDWGWPHAGANGDTCINTPNFDRVASEGILFRNAFVVSPSCTPSRNAFITGKYHWELGPGVNLWSTLPEQHQSFIHILADHGYVTGRNKAKTWGPGNLDNWIEAHGSHPAKEAYETFESFLEETDAGEKPFFFWLGTSDPHRGYKKDTGKESGIKISDVHLFAHFPDSDIIRSDVADYYFEVQRWDKLLGTVIAQLEKNDLLNNTIIIVSGDNGMPFPRCKSNLYDAGVHVPFAVRWGKKVKAGRDVNDFISFADIAPTLLEVTGIDVPDDMTGRSFANILFSKKSGMIDPDHRSDIVFGKERHATAQEKPNLGGYPSRGYRTADYLYIRNYRPELWPVGSGDTAATIFPGQWYANCDASPTKNYIINNKDKDEVHQRAFQLCFAKRPSEELYDLKTDPDEVNNVAEDPAYSEVLESMREKCLKKLKALHDPRAEDPNYSEFDKYPYYGGAGGTKK